MNKVMFIGHLGKDAEVRHTTGGKAMVNFTLATTTKWKDQQGKRQERTEWHRCTCWGERWENVVQYLHKGQKIYVEGEVRYREGEKDGVKTHYTDIHVDEIELIGPKRDDGARQERQQAKKQVEIDDDIPF
jgi:single-strand DNA-binding protein